MTKVEVGSIVRIIAPGSRESDGEMRVIPAVVMQQWADGSLQLYCLHFAGTPILANSVRVEDVEIAVRASSSALAPPEPPRFMASPVAK